MTPRAIVIVVGAAVASATAHPPNPHFRGVGDLPGGSHLSRAFDVEYHAQSGGITAVGESDTVDGVRAFRWSPAVGIQNLGVLEPGHTFSTARAVSYISGNAIVGASGPAPTDTIAFFWGETIGLHPIAPGTGINPTIAHAFIDDVAQYCVGQARTPIGSAAFVGNIASAVSMPSLGGMPEETAATDSSWNGSRRAGYSRDAQGNIQAVGWFFANPPTPLGFLNSTGIRESRALAIDYLGANIVGLSTSPNGPMEAVVWSGASPVIHGLGDLPGGEFRSAALAVSWGDAGLNTITVVGWGTTADGERAFVWTQADGMRDLNPVLAAAGYPVAGWTLQRATGISAKGKAICGVGLNPLGQTEGWVAYAPCYVDCNGDIQKTVADFGCFQTRFVTGDPYADCNEDGVLTVADFGCFQTAFASASNCSE